MKSFVSSGLVEREGGGGFVRAGGEADYEIQKLQKEANEKLEALYGGDIIEGREGNQKLLIIQGTHQRGGSLVPCSVRRGNHLRRGLYGNFELKMRGNKLKMVFIERNFT